ncbi:MAG: protein kinase [Pseudolysinimonas sp.]
MNSERIVAGHRVLRLLARGDRSEVWLAAGDVVLKVLTHPLGDGQPGLEARALHAARGEHVVELLDASSSDDEVVLVFPRLPRGSLAGLLAAGQGLDAGEAVTILAPLAACLARMHEAGVAHGALAATHVLFRSDGAPVVIGFGRAQLFEPGLPEVLREVVPSVVEDRLALASLAEAVLSRVTGARAAAAATFAESVRSTPLTDLDARLGRELFELAAARPVVFDRPVGEASGVRAIGVATVPQPAEAVARVGLAGRLIDAGPIAVARAAVRARWQRWTPGRRRLFTAAAAGAVVLFIALAVIPAPSAPVSDGATAAPEPAEPAIESPSSPSGVTGDDPLLALAALTRARDRCFRDLSVLCLDAVDQQDSSALNDDRAALDAVMDAGAPPPVVTSDEAVIVERLGDSALIALGPDSDPASVLLLKGEAGWRIRDYLAG